MALLPSSSNENDDEISSSTTINQSSHMCKWLIGDLYCDMVNKNSLRDTRCSHQLLCFVGSKQRKTARRWSETDDGKTVLQRSETHYVQRFEVKLLIFVRTFSEFFWFGSVRVTVRDCLCFVRSLMVTSASVVARVVIVHRVIVRVIVVVVA
jgi:hypothetical protein